MVTDGNAVNRCWYRSWGCCEALLVLGSFGLGSVSTFPRVGYSHVWGGDSFCCDTFKLVFVYYIYWAQMCYILPVGSSAGSHAPDKRGRVIRPCAAD